MKHEFFFVEVSLVRISTYPSCITTVNTTGLEFMERDEISNRFLAENWHGIPVPFEGERTLEVTKRNIRNVYRLKDLGRRLLVAVLGLEQVKLFREFRFQPWICINCWEIIQSVNPYLILISFAICRFKFTSTIGSVV
ncbi:hypothetical protein NPIL_639131 [Nephila pilipes]|uniref:Uncharacterized protein n=1 Tax=Nephila pilipes TaxID=299642 RepID=A0A8X6QHV7_NEPPI|nr:hypothetical protein NPIL_639131 [Nephila pilipes]